MDAVTEPRPVASSRIVGPSHAEAIGRVVASFDDPVVRSYSWGRFKIFRQRFLEEMGQYLPERGRVLDIGCGFGLFSLYYATRGPGRQLLGVDLSERRIGMARRAAERLGLTNARFEPADAQKITALESFDAVYLLDVLHHIAPDAVPGLLEAIHACLPPGGVLLVKELDTKPVWQRVFAHALDLLMSPDSPPHYWPQERLCEALERTGFTVKRHVLIDYLPYPHVLFIATKAGGPGTKGR